MPLYTDIDLSKVTTQQRDSVMNSLGLFYPNNLNKIQHNLYDQFFSLMMDCLVHLIYTPQEILQQYQQFQTASEPEQARALIIYDKEVQKTIHDRKFGETLHGEEMAIDVVENVLQNLPVDDRPGFLFTLANKVEPPINFNEENYPDYFNVVPDDEMSSLESQQRLQQIMAQQSRLNSANPGYNRVITPQGFDQMVQQPMLPAKPPALVKTYPQPQQNQNTQNYPQAQNLQPQNLQPQTNRPLLVSQPQFHPQPQNSQPQNMQLPPNPQPNSRNKSLEDLLDA